MNGRRLKAGVRTAVLAAAICGSASVAATAVYATYADVRPILTALAEILPPELRTAGAPEATWNAWAATYDRQIRARLERGDDDTMVNWLLLGTTFTSRPRAALDLAATDVSHLPPAIAARARDLVTALRTPGTDERRLFARRLLEAKGHSVGSAADRERLIAYLLGEVARVAGEQAGHARDLAAARSLGDTSQEFAARSRLFRTRGLSLDTSLQPAFAVDQSLRELRGRGLLKAGAIRDVAVIGPGLDFSDKSSGYDFYPQQSLQPFLLIDSLARLGLADAATVRVTTLDVSPRVNEHLAGMRRRATAGQPYRFRLPLAAGIVWHPDLVAYWSAAGSHIGAVSGAAAPAAGARVRAVSVRPRVALRVEPAELNIVVQRLAGRQFDLIVATNVFIYYDTLDQALALSNVAAMLRPGAVLLTNNALLELPSTPVRSVGYQTVRYSERPDDGDHVVWYQRQ